MDKVAQIRDLLESVEPIAYRRPDVTIEAVTAATGKALQLIQTADDQSSDEIRSVLSKIVPILVATTAGDATVIPRAMSLLLKLYEDDMVKSAYGNERPLDGLEKICSYRQNSTVEHVSLSLSVLDSWLESSNSFQHKLAIELLGNFLVVSSSGQYSEGNQFVMTSVPINTSEKLVAVRGRALALISKAMQSGDHESMIAAVKTTVKLGDARFGWSAAGHEKIWEMVAREKTQLLTVFGHILRRNPIFSIASAVEQRLWSWWRVGPDKVTQSCTRLLCDLPSSVEYALWKAINSDDLPLELASICDLEGTTSRDKFYIEFASLRESREPEHFADLINALNIGHRNSAKSWIELLDRVLPDENRNLSWRSRYVFFELARRMPDVALDIADAYERKAQRLDLRTNLLFGVRESDFKLWSTRLDNKLASSPRLIESEAAIPWINSVWGQSGISSREYSFLQEAMRSSNNSVRRVAAGAMGFISTADGSDPVEHLTEFVRQNPENASNWTSLFAAIDTKSRQLGDVLSEDVKKVVDLIKVEGSKAKIDRYGSEPGVTPFLTLIARKHPQILADLIEDSWKESNDQSWAHGPPGILSAWHVMDVFRRLDSSSEKRDWAEILAKWIVSRGPMVDFATEHLADVSTLDEPTAQTLIAKMLSKKTPEFRPVLLKLMWHFKEDDKYIDTMVGNLEQAREMDPAFFKELGDHFKMDIRYRSTSRTIGKPSPVDLQSQENLKSKLSEHSLSAEVRTVLREAIEGLEQHIENDLREDDELFRDR